jgi:hypothetical protein
MPHQKTTDWIEFYSNGLDQAPFDEELYIEVMFLDGVTDQFHVDEVDWGMIDNCAEIIAYRKLSCITEALKRVYKKGSSQ